MKEIARRLRENHPLGYTLPRDVTFWFFRCPKCEQWSPCDVRRLCDEVDPEQAESLDQFKERIVQ